MNKKHYQAIAEAIRSTRGVKETAKIALKLADFFEKESPSFKREKFLRASGW